MHFHVHDSAVNCWRLKGLVDRWDLASGTEAEPKEKGGFPVKAAL